MTDPRALADEAVLHLDRLGAVILDAVGDGPSPADLARHAAAARDAVAKIGVAALTQLTGLVAGVADSMVEGATEWSPSLGGTLLAAVDDLRHLADRSSSFSDEDSEHLHHRAAELSVYVRATSKPSANVIPSPSDDVILSPSEGSTRRAPDDGSSAPSATTPALPVVPISQLFFADGPQVVSGGVPKSAGKKSELLGLGIDALDNLTAKPFAAPIAVGLTSVVPVEALLYRGRAALERAAAIREQLKRSGGTAPTAVLDEMYDLIGLALKD